MLFMSKVHFETFLAYSFCDFFSAKKYSNNKFHYICHNNQHAVKLFEGFESLGFNEINIKGALIKYISINDQNVLIMLHDYNGKRAFTYHEDFIATIRDELNSYPGFSLLIIHNSTLDTILTTSADLSSAGSVFTNDYVAQRLVSLVNENKHLYDILIQRRSKIISDENRSIFAFENIYNCIVSGIINLKDEGLFNDERLFDVNSEKDLKGSLKENEKIYNDISSVMNNYGDLNASEKLEELNLSESFIKEYFLSGNQNKWQDLSFAEVQNEISKNKKRTLEFYGVQVDGHDCHTFKHMSDKGAANKNISILAEFDEKNERTEVKLIFSKGLPALSKDDFSFMKDCTISVHNGDNKSSATLLFHTENKYAFNYLKLSRNAAKEQYKFNILLAPKGFLNLAYIFNRIYISAVKNKNCLLLEYGQGCIDLNDNINLPTKVIKEQNENIVYSDVATLDYREIIEEVDSLYFKISDGQNEIPVQIIGSQVDEVITLPTILDPLRHQSITSSERVPQYKELSRKIIIAGRERGLSVDSQILCDFESKFITSGCLYINVDTNTSITLDEIDSSEIKEAYKKLYDWLQTKNTIISLTNWPVELVSLVKTVVESILLHYSTIDDGALTESDKTILKIGSFIKDGREWMTPLHPLCLAYCLELIDNFVNDEELSFKEMSDVTLERLNPAGLLPIISLSSSDYLCTLPHTHNPLWIELVPQRKSNHSYIAKLLLEKVEDFILCFSSLFINNQNKKVIINSVNHNENKEIFHGVIMYFLKYREKSHPIHVNIYNDTLFQTKFDLFSEEGDIKKARLIVSTNDASFGQIKSIEQCDEIIYLLREKLTFSKFDSSDNKQYSHITFFKNNQSVILQPALVDKTKSGITCGGLISGEASYLENGVYYTGYGTKGIKEKNALIKLSSYLNQLSAPSRNSTTKYNKDIISVLAVNESFRFELEKCYEKTIWTCIIDPKVTLDFFGNGKTILIHYSDKYTSSNSYDAITVTENIDLYKALLKQESDGVINSFNAMNGQWLLNIIKDASLKTSYSRNQAKEKQSIIAAYKFVSSILFKSDIVWIPISIGEMLRVARNTGLSLDSSDFSAVYNNYKGGPLSDDLLFVGFKDLSLFLLPVEVKARERGSDATKAVKQLTALINHMSMLLSGNSFKSKVLKSLFVQQVFSQIERYKIYNIYPANYFKNIEDVRDILTQGNYPIAKIENYFESFVIEFNNSMERVAINTNVVNKGKTAHITLPVSFFDMLHDKSIENLAEKLTDIKNYPNLSSSVIYTSKVVREELKIYMYNNMGGTDNNKENTIDDDGGKLEVISKISSESNANDISSSRIYLGDSLDIQERIYWEYGSPHLSNRHLAIFGSSGRGKTYCIQALLIELERCRCNSIIIDYTSGFLEEQLENEFINAVKPNSHIVASSPLAISPFRRQVTKVNGAEIIESDYIVASRIASAFKKIFSSTGEQQLALLSATIEEGIRDNSESFDFANLYDLLNSKGKVGESIANKIASFIKSNIFASTMSDIWSEYIHSNHIRNNIIQLATIPSSISTVAIEFILWDLYAYASSFGNKNQPIPIVLDEVQNLDLSLYSPLGKMLTEGRKYGLSLILATQTLSAFAKDDQDRLFLAAHKLFFAPAETELNTYAKILEQVVPGSNRKDWASQLINLQKGQCISVGMHKERNGEYKYGAIVINIAPLSGR